MADEPKPKRKHSRRSRFKTPRQVQTNLESISAAQQRSRKRRKQLAAEERDGGGEDIPLIDNMTKSEQAWLNQLRNVRHPEDLDDFE